MDRRTRLSWPEWLWRLRRRPRLFFSPADLLSQERELEAKFNGLMAGVGGEGIVGGLRSEARDFAAVGLVYIR